MPLRGFVFAAYDSTTFGNIRAFGITEDWKATALLKAEVWVETVTEGWQRFMAAWRKEEVDAARHRQDRRREKQRDLETCHHTRKRRILRSNTLDLVDESKGSLLCGRKTDRDQRSACTCVARFFLIFFSERAARGCALPDFFILFYLADHERVRPPSFFLYRFRFLFVLWRVRRTFFPSEWCFSTL